MCGRYLLGPDGKVLVPSIDDHGPGFDPLGDLIRRIRAEPWRGDIRPTQAVPVATSPDGAVIDAAWWLTPAWAKSVRDSRKLTTFNARLDGVATKPAFRAAWRASRRCLIPMLGYYEWPTIAGQKQRVVLRPADGTYLYAAGLWEQWEPRASADESPLTSCTMITTDARDDLAWVHPRSPMFVPAAAVADWFAAPPDAAMGLLQSITLPALAVDSVDGPLAA